MVVERREDVLRIAAVDAVAVLVEHEDVDEVRPGIDFVVRAKTAAAADDPCRRCATLTSTQTSLESTVPCVNRWPSFSVRRTTSSR